MFYYVDQKYFPSDIAVTFFLVSFSYFPSETDRK